MDIKRTHKWFAHAGVDGGTTIASIALLSSASDGLNDANGWQHNIFLYRDGKVTSRGARSSLILRQFLYEFFSA